MRETLPVLIVGAGPTGLALGCMLRRHQVPFHLIDEAEGPSLWSKAQVIHARTLEVFAALGRDLIDPVLQEGKRVHALPMFVNAWRGPQPGQEQAGEYPSGGPASQRAGSSDQRKRPGCSSSEIIVMRLSP